MAKIKKFKVSVNPFTYTCIVKYKNSQGVKFEYTKLFDEFDEWFTIDIDNELFDVHIIYDEELFVTIYDVNLDDKGNHQTDTSYNHEVDLKIVLND